MITEPAASHSRNTQLAIRVAIWVCIIAAMMLVAFGGVEWWWGHQVLRGTPVSQATNQTAVSPQLNDLGNYGSYLQGTVASMWALAGVLIIFVAFLVQAQQLNDQRKQFTAQNDAIKRQNFENRFFQLVNFHHKLVNDMAFEGEAGRECFRKWRDKLADIRTWLLDKEVKAGFAPASVPLPSGERNRSIEAYNQLYSAHQGTLGHYFRNLYHIIKFVNVSKDIPEQEKRDYTNLVSVQLSSCELALLFYHGIHPEGAGFKPLIEKYGLLRDLDKERFLFKPDHRCFFKEQAYEGSQPGNGLAETSNAPKPADN
jgi:hypothetical protein